MHKSMVVATALALVSMCVMEASGQADRERGEGRRGTPRERPGWRPQGDTPSDPTLAGEDRTMEEGAIGRAIANPRVAEKLGLSAEQATRLAGEMDTLRAEHDTLRAQLEASALDQVKLMSGPAVDEGAVMAAVEKSGAIRTQMAKVRMRQLFVLKKNLSPEQLATVRHLMRSRMQTRMGGGGDIRRGAGRPRPE